MAYLSPFFNSQSISKTNLFSGSMTAFLEADLVIIAAVLTAVIVFALTLYACTTKTDFTMCGGFLFMMCIGLIGATILSMFWQNRILQIIITYGGALLFGVYLIYDTQLICGKHSHKLSVDDYVLGAMMLYIDIIQLFIYILRILGEHR